MTTRTERRRNTEERILAAARSIFAERGFERGTIRAIAAEAGVDPALVMQYFGSKTELFSRAIGHTMPRPGDNSELTEFLLENLRLKVGGLPETSVAMLRSMLTHPQAADTARARLGEQVDAIASEITGPDRELRAALLIMTMLGVTIGRQLLEIDVLRERDPDRIAELLRPCFQALIDPS